MDKSNMKKYILTAVTLGVIAMASGLLIGATNFITRKPIDRNETNKINNGFVKLFGDGASSKEEEHVIFEEGKYEYTKELYAIYNNDNICGYAVKTSGSTMYGSLSLLIGIEPANSYALTDIIVLDDGQTYASTFEDEYVKKVNKGKRDYNEVSCGATYAATLARKMINEATTVVKENTTNK